ncbi:MAG: hypothetical protein LWX51_00515 [Deltaproteobacteria bacterium]|jgi:hypothetical protein|nr:hypothetical protein [Deltaproteobacteria bacterium]
MSEQLNKNLILLLLWLVLSVGFSSFAYGAEHAISIDVLSDSSVLVSTITSHGLDGRARRLTIDTGGNLTATNEFLNGFFKKAIGAPNNMSGLAISYSGIRSFKIPGLIPIDKYYPSPGGLLTVSVLINPQGDRVFLLYDNVRERRIDVINYNSDTGTLDDVPLFTIPVGRGSGGATTGVDEMAITQDGAKLYVTPPAWQYGNYLNVYNARTGDLLTSLGLGGSHATEVCLSDNGDVGMVVNSDGSVVAFDVSTDTVLGRLSAGSGMFHQCAITADGTLGFVNDRSGRRVWVVDLTASPPRLAPGTNPISVSNPIGDMSISLDQQFLIVTSTGSGPRPLLVIDISSRKVIHTFTFNTLPITATAKGSQTPEVKDPSCDPMVINGDFIITPDGFDPGHRLPLGDGVNEGTSWSFDFKTDPEFQCFPTSLPLASALLTLELTPKGSGISTDAFKINLIGFPPIITPVIQELPIGVTSTIQIELTNFYRNRALPDLLKATHGDSIPAFYADDAIVSFAELTLTSFAGGKVNDRFPDLGPEDVDTDFDATPCAENCVGTFTITAEFRNTSSDTLSDLFFEVGDLTGGNVLCNADGGVPWGYGADFTVPMDGVLKPQESFTVIFEIGLRSMNPFIFEVDLFGKVQK